METKQLIVGDLITRKDHGKLKYYIVLETKMKKGKQRIKTVGFHNISALCKWKMYSIPQYKLAWRSEDINDNKVN